MVDKNIFLIWLGDAVPSYVPFAVNAFRIANQSFKIQFVHKTIKDIERIVIKNEIDQCLLDSINIINGTYKISQQYQDYVDNQKKLYGSDIRFIQLLSDIFRVQLVNSLGGIYLDCDTFPNRPFDENLLSSPFCVMSHQNGSLAPAVDNYFFGLPKGHSLQRCIADGNINLTTQTYVHWQADINYIMRKKKFKECKLSSNDFSKDSSFYIEHYPSSNWKLHPEKIPLCKYDFCEEFIKLKNAFAN